MQARVREGRRGEYVRRSRSTLGEAVCDCRLECRWSRVQFTVGLTFSTAEIPRAQRLSSLREVVNEQFLGLYVAPLGRDTGAQLDAVMNIRELGGVRIARFCGPPLAAVRTPGHVDLS